MSKSRRLAIITPAEVEDLYSVPSFNESYQRFYFTLDDKELAELSRIRQRKYRRVAIALLGYFKCKPILLNPTYKSMQEDLAFIARYHFNGLKFRRFSLKADRKFRKLSLRKPINTQNIMDHWDTIQRIAVSLTQRKTNQATLVRKLSGYKNNHPLLKALTEYNRLIKAQYLLDYIDDASLRTHVQRVLNRGEAYHQLRRAISNVNSDRFRGNSDEEIQIWNESARLVANAIIYFNSKVLSNLLDSFEEQGNERYQGIVKQASPVAWENIT